MFPKVFHVMYAAINVALLLHTSCSYAVSELPEKKLNNLVILQYHHVANNTPAITSTTIEQFEQHMALLNEEYNVVSLQDTLNKIRSGEAIPNKSVAITFDDGFTDIAENAYPILQRYNFPFTVFVNPGSVGSSKHQMTWQRMKEMQPLANFANHSMHHNHLLDRPASESEQTWLENVLVDIDNAQAMLVAKLNVTNKWLAYPYGEFNHELKQALLSKGYIGFGQQSGAVSSISDFAALPRFPLSGIYANVDSLRDKLNSLAMPVTRIGPKSNAFRNGSEISSLVLKIDSDDLNARWFACYLNGKRLNHHSQTDKINVEVNLSLKLGRNRINCTAPSKSMPGRYYWYSYPIFTANDEGTFVD